MVRGGPWAAARKGRAALNGCRERPVYQKARLWLDAGRGEEERRAIANWP